ncbi:hypothetical protein N656DRAFT_158017 [Canariomyces notabilis]|uniref:Uncharacterized protein n=1 Tax=Canariomyces notabilis TaxID=2074819 RepID=A0AAN6TBN3_9PEZI|nr:hypothetical protein N656DRAFT_158017 [Canariomyces arenarius]
MTSEQPSALSSIREAQQKSVTIITAKLETILESHDTAQKTTSQLSTDLEHQIRKILQCLENQLESLAKQLSEKAEENGMVSTLYKRKEAECEEHMKELASLRDTARKQAEQIHELEANLIAMDAAHDDSEERIRQLEVTGKEAIRLREEVKSKTAVITELQSKLDAKEKAYESQVENLTSSVNQIAQSMQENDRLSRIVADQAAAIARQDSMERSAAETTKLAIQGERERKVLADHLEKLKEEIQQKEQNERRDASIIQSLQQSLATAESNRKAAVQELNQLSTRQDQLESRLTTKIQDLETKLEAAQGKVVELEKENNSHRARSRALVDILRKWTVQEGLYFDDLSFLSDGGIGVEEITARLAQVLGQLSLPQKSGKTPDGECPENTSRPGETSKFFPGNPGETPQETSNKQSDLGQPDRDNSSSTLGDHSGAKGGVAGSALEGANPQLQLHHLRKVIVRSPANVPTEPVPPSVDQEKTRRREALQPRSIMKRVTRSRSSLSQHVDPDPMSENGAFVRLTDESHTIDPLTLIESGNKALGNGSGSAPNEWPAQRTTAAASGRSGKRRRSDTAAIERPGGQGGRSKQIRIERLDSTALARTDEPVVPDSQPPAVLEPKVGERRHHEHTSGQSKPKNKSVAARSSGSDAGFGSQTANGSSSRSFRQVLRPRPANMRTYGSQKTEKPTAVGGQADSQSTQTRYWSRSKDSQASAIFSQDVVNPGEDLLLPFQGQDQGRNIA